MWADTLLILAISICTALLGEGKHFPGYFVSYTGRIHQTGAVSKEHSYIHLLGMVEYLDIRIFDIRIISTEVIASHSNIRLRSIRNRKFE